MRSSTLLTLLAVLAMASIQPLKAIPAGGIDQIRIRVIDPNPADPLQDGIPQARVVVTNTSTGQADTVLTDVNGEVLIGVDPAGLYDVRVLEGPVPLPVKVSVLDMLLIQKHIIGIKSITGPESLLAADVNRNCAISVSDLSLLRQAILNPAILKDLPWAFYPEDIQFFNPANPCAGSTGTAISFDASAWPGPDVPVLTFHGVAFGDVSGQ